MSSEKGAKPECIGYASRNLQGLNCLSPKPTAKGTTLSNQAFRRANLAEKRLNSNLISNCTLDFSYGAKHLTTWLYYFDITLYFCFCFANSLDWAGYDEKFKGKPILNLI